ncbi:hypothetical protein [Aliiroseovarius sp. S253]|uniref:hypothetical protein n=1 Tax=Aliiroseovarius sp. S253 TaxID=3415133 RepID=UPI003C79DBBF
MTSLTIKATLYRRLLGAMAIATVLSSCAVLDRVGGTMKNAVGLGDCSVPASNGGLVEQTVDSSADDLANGDRTVLYTSENQRAKKPAGCWWAKSPSQKAVAEEMGVTEEKPANKAASTVTASAAGLTEDDRETVAEEDPAWGISYLGIQTERLDDDLVQINVRLEGEVHNENVAAYAECAAAQYTLSRGYGFARHVLTSVTQKDSIWTGKSVFWVSETLPDGLITIDAAVTAQSCFENGIPTV